MGSSLGQGTSPGEGSGPLSTHLLEHSMERGALAGFSPSGRKIAGLNTFKQETSSETVTKRCLILPYFTRTIGRELTEGLTRNSLLQQISYSTAPQSIRWWSKPVCDHERCVQQKLYNALQVRTSGFFKREKLFRYIEIFKNCSHYEVNSLGSSFSPKLLINMHRRTNSF